MLSMSLWRFRCRWVSEKHPLKGPATKTCPFMTHTHTHVFTKVFGLLPQKENIQQNSDNYRQVLGGKKKLPDTSSTWQNVLPKNGIIFQPSMFRGYVSFTETNRVGTLCYPVAPCVPTKQKHVVFLHEKQKRMFVPVAFLHDRQHNVAESLEASRSYLSIWRPGPVVLE